MRILVTGGTGFIGNNTVTFLKEKYEVVSVGSKDYNLIHPAECDKMFSDIRPDVVVHLAARSGGILANREYPADFLFCNLMMTGNIFEYSKNYKVKKLVYFCPGCCFPANATVPVHEESIFDGFPDLAPAPSASAKKMGVLASYSYKKQYGLNSCVIIPSNAYGPNDLFCERNSHVIPALILKFDKAKKENLKDVTLWGDGTAIRDFIYIDDVVNKLPFFIENDISFTSENPCLENVCNISTGTGVSIRKLACTIQEVVGFKGNIKWDISKPNGPANKTFSNTRMTSLGLKCETGLRHGLEQTYQWFQSQSV